MNANVLPTHHLDEERLIAYVAGTTSEAESLVVAAHVTLCPYCRAQCEQLEQVAAALLFEGVEEPTITLEKRASEPATAITDASFSDDLVGVPRPVLQRLQARTWRYYGPGVQSIGLAADWNGIGARLFRLAPGSTVPRHGHRATELLMVLSGGYDDPSGTYLRGDIHASGPDSEHALQIHREAPCVALVAYEDRLIPKTLRGRLFALIRGI